MTYGRHTRRLLIGVCVVCGTRADHAGAATLVAAPTGTIGTSAADRTADSLYRAGRDALARRDYRGAAELFASVLSRYPGAEVAGNAQYWRAYSLYASGNATRRLSDFRGALAALDAEERRYAGASTAGEGRDLRARVIEAEATLGDARARDALDAAVAGLAQPLSCDEADLALKLVALERLIDRDQESAMPTIRRVLSTQGPCMDHVRHTTSIVVANTPLMNATKLMDDLARADRSLQLMPSDLPPIRPLGTIVARSKDSVGNILSIRPLSDGRVLAHDARGRRVVLFDSSLAHFVTVADTTGGVARAYGANGGVLFSFYGDSSLYVDRASMSMVVIDPKGKIGRVMAIPGPTTMGPNFATSVYDAVFDGAGHFVYQPQDGSGPELQPGDQKLTWSDSASIVRIDIATRRVDTLAKLKTFSEWFSWQTVSASGARNSGGMEVSSPLHPTDGWAVLPNGTLAVVRVGDYRIEWIAPDGTRTVSPKIQHAWARITDSMKIVMMDSVKRADSAQKVNAAASRANPMRMTWPSTPFLDPNDLPDYWPPFNGAMAVKADADGNLWIRTYQPQPIDGGPVFDIVSRQGTLIDRIQIPGGTTIEGFGPGVVYLTSRDGDGSHLARALIH